MIKQIPLALELSNRMMRRPPNNRLKDPSRIRKRTHGARARSIHEIVRISRRVREVVRAIILVHPRRLEEPSIVVIRLDRLARLRRQKHQILRRARERAHVRVQFPNDGHQRGHVARRLLRARPAGVELARHPALQLAAPDPAKVEIRLPVVVDKGRGIDAVAAGNGLGVRDERALGLVTLRDANAEDALLVARREVEEVFPVLVGGVWRPHLLRDPGDVGGFEGDAVIGHGPAHGVHRDDVVVVHVVLVAIVVVGLGGFDIVRGVDVESAVEDVGGGIRGVDVSDERLVSRHCGGPFWGDGGVESGLVESWRLEMERNWERNRDSGYICSFSSTIVYNTAKTTIAKLFIYIHFAIPQIWHYSTPQWRCERGGSGLHGTVVRSFGAWGGKAASEISRLPGLLARVAANFASAAVLAQRNSNREPRRA